MPNLMDTAIAQLEALGTQVQQLIDQLNAYNVAGATQTAQMLQNNIAASQQHLRNVAASDTYSMTGGPPGFPQPPPMQTEPTPPQEPEPPPTEPPSETDTDPQTTSTTPGWDDQGEIPPVTAKHHKHNKRDD